MQVSRLKIESPVELTRLGGLYKSSISEANRLGLVVMIIIQVEAVVG
jgi:hypothetical protein